LTRAIFLSTASISGDMIPLNIIAVSLQFSKGFRNSTLPSGKMSELVTSRNWDHVLPLTRPLTLRVLKLL
jgi:hypothetical protein